MKNTLKSVVVSFLSLGLCIIATAPIYGSDRESMAKLNVMAALIRAATGGYCRSQANGMYLDQDDSYTIKTTLFRGNSYVILGAGDSATRDMDIVLYDENYNHISEDSKTDAEPIVEVSPRWSGTFYIHVRMYRGSGYSNVAICHQ